MDPEHACPPANIPLPHELQVKYQKVWYLISETQAVISATQAIIGVSELLLLSQMQSYETAPFWNLEHYSCLLVEGPPD